jgi:cytidyltransferase-like protein
MIIPFKDVATIREKYPNKTIVLAAGTFDLPHAGHVLFLEEAKKLGDIVVVMVGSDAAVTRAKGANRPIINQHLRLKMIDSLKPVDYTFIDCYEDREDFIVFMMDEAFKFLKPDILIVNNDRSDISFREELGKKHGVQIVVLDRVAPPEFDEVSTTKIIAAISKFTEKDS